MATITKTIPATEAQIKFYASLSADFATRMGGLAGTPDEARTKAAAWASAHTLSEVSNAITSLKDKIAAMPKPKVEVEVESGYYTLGEKTYFVTISKTSKKPYAKLWTVKPGMKKASWMYAPGVVQQLVGQAPMTLAEAKAFGHSHGYCIRCGAILSDPKSVEAGIGPVCAKYWA